MKSSPPRQNDDAIYQLLQKHDETLQTITQLIQELLLSDKKSFAAAATAENKHPRPAKPKMCSVETMTSKVWPDEEERTPQRKAIPSARHRGLAARNGQFEQHSPYEEMFASETIYINRLASKYLVTGEKNEPMQPRRQKENIFESRAPRKDSLDGSFGSNGGDREISSIATEKYLEKYGLANDRRSATRPHNGQRKTTQSGHQSERPSNRILDLERLKRQPKYT